uniref:Uncharacterized protein n=1 Tax=Panagrolaimus davidi TaxID=227884 RepID=A0A914QX44_9BILA
MRPYLQVFHICNTGGISSASYQSYRISWYRIPPHHIVKSSDNHPYYISPLSLNGEGFIESVWSHCPFVDCMKELDEADERRYLDILHNTGGYAT